MGNVEAAPVPTTVTATAAHFSFIPEEMDTLDTPAEYASRNVVVTVDSTTIRSPVRPSPAFTMMTEMSYSPVWMAAPIPMTYMKMLMMPYTAALAAVAAKGFSASLV